MSATTRSAPGRIVALSLRALPAGYRPRYRVEFASGLADIPRREQVPYALRILVRSLALRSALTTYRPTIGETLMARNTSPYNTSALRQRQRSADVGHAVLGSEGRVTSRKRWRIIMIPLVVLLLGLILGMWGPLPGLGMFLVLGGAMGLVVAAIEAFNDMFS